MKWRLSLLLITLLILPVLFLPSKGITGTHPVIDGGGGGAYYFPYSKTIVIQPSSTQVVQQTKTGSTWQNLPWLDPYYVCIINTNQLQILPPAETSTVKEDVANDNDSAFKPVEV